jgi:uncharacterized membrane protein
VKMMLTYLTTVLVFLAIDMVWLGFVARTIYTSEMGPLLRTQVDYRAAVAFYLLYAVGLMYFAILPAIESKSVVQGLMLGGGLGLVAYGTYDLTNLSIMNGFGTKIALIDLAWGAVLSAVTSASVVALINRFN